MYTLPETNPPEDEVIATAMLMGEQVPVRCSMCLGSGRIKRLFGWARCVQCEGLGWDGISTAMRQWVINNKLPER